MSVSFANSVPEWIKTSSYSNIFMHGYELIKVFWTIINEIKKNSGNWENGMAIALSCVTENYLIADLKLNSMISKNISTLEFSRQLMSGDKTLTVS